MKAIGEIYDWVLPRKSRRVLKLLRMHARENELKFVIKYSRRRKASRKIYAEFPEEPSTFRPRVRFLSKSAQPPADNENE